MSRSSPTHSKHSVFVEWVHVYLFNQVSHILPLGTKSEEKRGDVHQRVQTSSYKMSKF